MGGPFAKLASGFAVASSLGLGFAAVTALGVYVGYRCDRALGWRFYGCTLTLGLAGGAAGLIFVLRTISALDDRTGDSPKSTPDAKREDRRNE